MFSIQFAKSILIASLIALAALYLLIAIGSAPSPSPFVQAVYSSVSAGGQGRLWNGNTDVPVAMDEEGLPDVISLAGAHDSNSTPLFAGRIFFVASDVPVQVSESDGGAARVKILAGPQKGRSGWVAVDWVKPLDE